MEVNKIQEELARLIELVDGWAGSHDVPGIERDLVLDKLKKLYEAIRFANFDEGDSSASASVAAQQSVAEVAPVSEISIDLDDLLAEPVRDSLPEPAAMPEALGESAGVSAAVPFALRPCGPRSENAGPRLRRRCWSCCKETDGCISRRCGRRYPAPPFRCRNVFSAAASRFG